MICAVLHGATPYVLCTTAPALEACCARDLVPWCPGLVVRLSGWVTCMWGFLSISAVAAAATSSNRLRVLDGGRAVAKCVDRSSPSLFLLRHALAHPSRPSRLMRAVT